MSTLIEIVDIEAEKSVVSQFVADKIICGFDTANIPEWGDLTVLQWNRIMAQRHVRGHLLTESELLRILRSDDGDYAHR